METYYHQGKKKQIPNQNKFGTGQAFYFFENCKLQIKNYIRYGISCFMLDFIVFFRSLKKFLSELPE
ncbi:hypothetical protein A3F97_02180 [Candidatus Nomurabacteria bacterium RIFCSPLOWO2_12_FULL_41_10]|uniref:Uncharacterized protein n=1 Tax=Candidatus Nomurabacteria bacterium RIFCSPLOWO2_12_FULL_41_10 TaxID=1801795 RepID=A0A1F6YD18_9BACT|nr:MAG: hypothetical protein A3F97_02180 [Candidatus Nomurabacteria bacterium RIFCSPLOWO2_12_FULL_41_10]